MSYFQCYTAQLLNMMRLTKCLDNIQPMHTSNNVKFNEGRALATAALKGNGSKYKVLCVNSGEAQTFLIT